MDFIHKLFTAEYATDIALFTGVSHDDFGTLIELLPKLGAGVFSGLSNTCGAHPSETRLR